MYKLIANRRLNSHTFTGHLIIATVLCLMVSWGIETVAKGLFGSALL